MKLVHTVTHNEVYVQAHRIATEIYKIRGEPSNDAGAIRIYGVPRGGVPVAYVVAGLLRRAKVVNIPHEADVIVDDIEDSGATRERHAQYHAPFFTLFKAADQGGQWLVFPWEASAEASATDIPIRLLQFIGEDVSREGLRETPKRFLKAWAEYTSGYAVDPNSLLTTFEDGSQNYDEMVVVKDILVYSHCEHHLAPMFGVAHVAYVPDGKILGLSKFARLIDVYAKRLQVQERMTQQIANQLMTALGARGVGVVMELRHLCMEQRGIKARGATTVTSSLLGVLREDQAARAEFMRLIR